MYCNVHVHTANCTLVLLKSIFLHVRSTCTYDVGQDITRQTQLSLTWVPSMKSTVFCHCTRVREFSPVSLQVALPLTVYLAVYFPRL